MKTNRLLSSAFLAFAILASSLAVRAGSCAIEFHLPPVPPPAAQVEKASFYSEECRGLPMANGRPFDPDRFTCASWAYPLGTVLAISSGERTVHVTVTDRGPARRLVARGVVIDLARAAFAALGDTRLGHLPVTIAVVSRPS